MTLLPAAATAIGSNLGSTTTLIFSFFGANPVAKRVVDSHVIFNIFTAVVSLITALLFFQYLLHLGTASTTSLAIFHTILMYWVCY
jgi:phosphate:Na+ symporter